MKSVPRPPIQRGARRNHKKFRGNTPSESEWGTVQSARVRVTHEAPGVLYPRHGARRTQLVFQTSPAATPVRLVARSTHAGVQEFLFRYNARANTVVFRRQVRP